MGRVGTHRQQVVSEDHSKSSFYLDQPEMLEQTSPDRWIIRSKRDATVFYIVHRRSDFSKDTHRCLIHCRFCAVCPHEFICKCPRNRRGGNTPCSHIHSIQILFGIHHPPQRVPLNTPSSLTATVNDEVQSVADVSVPMELNTQDGNDVALGRSRQIEMVCKKVELLREKLARVKNQFLSSTIGEEKIASVEAQLNQAFRLVNAISATNTSSLPVGRKGCRKKMIRQARSFQEMRITKAKERAKQQRQSVLLLSKKKMVSEKRQLKRRQENEEAREQLEKLLTDVRCLESQ
uniref:SWIM-type domain-containing protein n=1 Tax=Plectus sambesii TaxID=2011161 RepID=A0A914WHF2_9BILA